MSDVTFEMQSNRMEVHQRNAEPWSVTLVDTGDDSMTGGRLKRVQARQDFSRKLKWDPSDFSSEKLPGD